MKKTKTNMGSFAQTKNMAIRLDGLQNFFSTKLQAKKRSFFAITLVVMAIIPVYAQQYNSESDFQIDWDPNVKDGVIITKYIGTRKEVSIPPSIQNNPVTGIGAKAFNSNRNITKVIIPNSVKTIMNGGYIDDYGAFFNCTSLTSVTIPDSVTSIEESTFANCTSLTNINIPKSVTSIKNGAFADCTKLAGVNIENGVTEILSGGNYYGAFSGCTSLAGITIPSSVTIIGEWAFYNCTGLNSITFQGAITSNNFSKYDPFPGDLRDVYLASDGGPGTYKRFAGGSTWKKQ